MISFRTAATLLITACVGVPAAAYGAGAYRDAANGFAVEPPAFARLAGQGAVQAVTFAGPATDGFAPNCNVQVQAAELSLDAYEELTNKQFDAAGWVVSERSALQVSGKPALHWRYSGALRGRNFEWLAAVVAAPGRFYLLTCTALKAQFAANEASFQKSIDSFRVD